MRISSHRLEGEEVRQMDSPNRGGLYEPGNPDTIVIHYTATATAAAAIQILCDPAREVSAHLVIGRDGAITQLLPFDTIGWHAGQSAWGARQGFNHYAIGLEVENAGQLREEEGRYVSTAGQEYPEEEVFWAVHRNQTEATCWHRFTEVQVRAVEEICVRLIQEYGIAHILGHEEIAPDRKIDPGPAFPLDGLRGRLLYPSAAVVGREGVVQSGRLNLRTGPTGRADRVAGFLKQGTRVKVLEEQKQWCRVAVELEGWVWKRGVEEG